MPQELTIASGLITVACPVVVKRLEKGSELSFDELDDNFDSSFRLYKVEVSPESGGADNLDGINGPGLDDMVLLRAVSGSLITVRHDIVNLRLLDGENFVLTDNRTMMLVRTAGEFLEVSRSNNV